MSRAAQARPAPAPANGADPHPDGVAEPHRVLVDARPARAPAERHAREQVAPAPALRTRLQPAAPGPDGRPRAPRREVEVEIPGYDGFRCWLWANYPRRLLDELNSNDEPRIAAALRVILVEHNGWCDAGGEPYPAADDPAFYTAIPLELAVLIARCVAQVPAVYPQSLSPTGGR
jgi:hypothetical protein